MRTRDAVVVEQSRRAVHQESISAWGMVSSIFLDGPKGFIDNLHLTCKVFILLSYLIRTFATFDFLILLAGWGSPD
jgi:hypothetical protein